MAKVIFSSELQKLTGEEDSVFDVVSYRELIDAMISKYPALEKEKLMHLAIAIDGEIIHEPLLEKLIPSNEIHFFPFLAGG